MTFALLYIYVEPCPVHLTVLVAKSEDYTNALPHLQCSHSPLLQYGLVAVNQIIHISLMTVALHQKALIMSDETAKLQCCTDVDFKSVLKIFLPELF